MSPIRSLDGRIWLLIMQSHSQLSYKWKRRYTFTQSQESIRMNARLADFARWHTYDTQDPRPGLLWSDYGRPHIVSSSCECFATDLSAWSTKRGSAKFTVVQNLPDCGIGPHWMGTSHCWLTSQISAGDRYGASSGFIETQQMQVVPWHWYWARNFFSHGVTTLSLVRNIERT